MFNCSLKKTKYTLFLLIFEFLLVMGILNRCTIGNNQESSLTPISDSIINVSEVDNKIVFSNVSSIIFSSKKDNYFNLYSYKDETVCSVLKADRDIFSPFFLYNRINGLSDINGK